MERLFDEIPKVNTHHASLLLNPDAGFGRINDEVHRSYELNYNSSYIYQPQPYAGVIDRDGGYTLRRGFGETSSMSSSSRSPSPMGNDSVRRSPHYNGHRCVTTAQPEELYLLEQLRSLHIQENANGLRAEPPYWDGYSTLNRFDLSDSFQLDGVVSPHMFCCSDQIANPRRFSCEELHAYGGLNPCSDPKSERRSAFDSLPAEFFLHRNGDRINPNHGVLNSQGPFYTVPNDLHRCLATPDGGTQMLQHMPAQHSAGIQWNTYDFGCDGSFIQQGKRLPCVGCNRNDSRRYTKRFQVYDSLSDEIKYTSFADTMLEMKETIYRIARDQDGCRFLQIKFDEGRMDEINAIFDGVIDHVVELMENTFGNYLMQKLLDVCSDEQRMSIVLMLTRDPSDLVRISLNSHGTRSVQKLIETLKTRQEILLIIGAIRPGFLKLIKDPHGNHVIQKCFVSLTPEDNKLLFDATAKYCADIAINRHGCCVLQTCISRSYGDYQAKLIYELSMNSIQLAQDPYGNYVVQYILGLKNPMARANIISQFEGKYVELSINKFSSNVVEKCLKVFEDGDRETIVIELLSVPKFEQLLQDPYANYVMQSALKTTKGGLHAALVEAMRPYASKLKSSPYCKQLFSQSCFKK